MNYANFRKFRNFPVSFFPKRFAMRFLHSIVPGRFPACAAAIVLAAALVPQFTGPLRAQTVANGYVRAVGGISIKADGLIENARPDVLGKLAVERARLVKTAPADFRVTTSLRKVSLRGIEEAIETALKAGKNLPDEIVFLAGLQEIRYVFVYPDEKDIVLVGFGEGWRTDTRGNIVGLTTGRPVLLLDDLLTALRTAEASARTGISCSIDPTADGIQQFRDYAASLKIMNDKRGISSHMEKALGRQQVSFTGVPATSHFASLLVAADYRMKRLAMGFEPSPVQNMPSFLQMYKATGVGMDNMLQRWWLEPKFDAVFRSPDGLAWEFDGAGVVCMTEEDFATTNGQREHSGKPSAIAQKWADCMTAHYDELATAEPVFGELRNCMQLAMVGALVARERLTDKAGCMLAALLQESILKTIELPAPTQIDSRVSMVKQGRNWIISASGGIDIRPEQFVSQARESRDPAQARAKAKQGGKAWCWN
jgi:hypothetical protein